MTPKTTQVVVRVRKAGDENLYDPTYLLDPTRDELLELIAEMGDVNVNWFYQGPDGVSRRSSNRVESVAVERQAN